MRTAEVVICGAGIAGVATAYHLARKGHGDGVVLVDERPPLSLTSDKSTECYRNWWPGPDDAMVQLMNRSIDLLEELALASDNRFSLNRRGYLFATRDPERLEAYRQAGLQAEAYGAGPLRLHEGGQDPDPNLLHQVEGFDSPLRGADLIADPALLLRAFPYLAPDLIGALHVRRAGWLSAQQLGMYLLEQAASAGVERLEGRLSEVRVSGGRVAGVALADGRSIDTPVLVNAAGPYLKDVGLKMGLDLPVSAEPHLKMAFKDHLQVVPRDAPLLILGDPQHLNWDDEERAYLEGTEEGREMLDLFPSGVHTRPEGGAGSQILLVLWEYNSRKMEPVFPVPMDPAYPEIVLRGLTRLVPGVEPYLRRIPQPALDGGYYIKTQENRPLAGATSVEGAFVIGALSGFGIMAAPALGELVAAAISEESPLPYAAAFSLDRYQDPVYLERIQLGAESWQL
jgi:glycine/D-amino acid oxidase-like deaminating enzyme